MTSTDTRSVSVEDYRREQAEAMSEKALQQHIVDAARKLGYLVYHTFDSRRSEPGYPDLTMVHPQQKRIIFAELKREGKHPTDAQYRWLFGIAVIAHDETPIRAYIWRPSDWLSGEIERALTGDSESEESK